MKLFRRCSLHVFLLIFTRSSCVNTLCFKKCNTQKSICTVYYNVWMRRQCDAWSKADRKSAVINSGRKSTKILRRSRQALIKSTIIIYTESTKTAAAAGGGVVAMPTTLGESLVVPVAVSRDAIDAGRINDSFDGRSFGEKRVGRRSFAVSTSLIVFPRNWTRLATSLSISPSPSPRSQSVSAPCL